MRANSGWAARTNGSWHKFLQDNGVWQQGKGQKTTIEGTWTFNVPVKAYYTVNGSCDNNGTVWIDGKQVLAINDFKNLYNSSVL